jgi:hypothetical protein
MIRLCDLAPDGLVGVHVEEAAAAAVPHHGPVPASGGRDDLLSVGPSPSAPETAALAAAAEEEEGRDHGNGGEGGSARLRGRPVLELPDQPLQRGEDEAEQLSEPRRDLIPRNRVAGAEAQGFARRVGRDHELPWCHLHGLPCVCCAS